VPNIVIACTVNEEYGFSGVRALSRLWNQPGGFLPRRPDAAIVAEPTDLDVVVAHKGVLRWRCHTHGLACHSSRPEAGENAIYKMARVLIPLERYQKEVLPILAPHALCGSATMSVGTIHGGVSANIVPDRCTIEIDRRLSPGEDAQSARQGLIEYLAGAAPEVTTEHDPSSMFGPALSDAANGPLAERLAASVRTVVGRCKVMGVPYATNAAFLAAEGIPTVVFGPGSIAQAHTADEWIPLDQLHAAVEILDRFACG
jgi:acetylornithine deacetylase